MSSPNAGSHVAWRTLLLALLMTSPAAAQSAADSAAIRNTALDYAHGWYTADAARMQRALHPELAKRIVLNRDGNFVLDHITAAQLVEITGSGVGNTAAGARRAEVRILDIFGNAASVRLTMDSFTDYLHVARWEDRWIVVNVLWELAPR